MRVCISGITKAPGNKNSDEVAPVLICPLETTCLIEVKSYSMGLLLFFLISFSLVFSAEDQCTVTIRSVSELDECLKSKNLKPTKSIKEILNWKQKLNISEPLTIDPEKIQEIVNCPPNANSRTVATKLSEEVEKILKIGSLQISDWKVPNFPETGAKDYGMKKTAGCDPKDLLYQMKKDVEQLKPDLTNVYNLGLALDTTDSQNQNITILANSVDAVFESLPRNAKIAFAVTAYGDEFRGGLRFEGDKDYVLPRLKNFLLSQRIYGGGTAPESVYGGSYVTSKNLGRAHGLIFNWTNAPSDNTKATTRNGKIDYTLRELNGFAIQNVHIIRNVFLTCK